LAGFDGKLRTVGVDLNDECAAAPPGRRHAYHFSVDMLSTPAGRAKSCSAYGAGFVNVPGTDACIKMGGYVTTEGAINRGR
jgi:hypothetical protein